MIPPPRSMGIEVITLTKDDLDTIIRNTACAVANDLRYDIEHLKTPEMMTKEDLRKYLRCDMSKINRYMKKGLPYVKFGDTPRFRKSDIDAWLEGKI